MRSASSEVDSKDLPGVVTNIGELLISKGLASELEIRRAVTVQQSVNGRLKLGSILMIGGVLSEHRLLRVLMDVYGVPAVTWRSLSEANEQTVRILSPEDAIRWNAVAYAAHQQVIGVAFSRPSPKAAAEISARTGMKVLPGVAPDVRILQAHEHFYFRPIEEAVRGLLASSQRSGAPRLALEEFLLVCQDSSAKCPLAPSEPESSAAARSEVMASAAVPEIAPSSSGSRKPLRDPVVETLAEFDRLSREIFIGGAGSRELSVPREASETYGDAAVRADSAAAIDPPQPRRKTGFTTEDLREMLNANAPPARSSSPGRRKTRFTTADLRQLLGG